MTNNWIDNDPNAKKTLSSDTTSLLDRSAPTSTTSIKVEELLDDSTYFIVCPVYFCVNIPLEGSAARGSALASAAKGEESLREGM